MSATQRLPEELAEEMQPELRLALQHPLRRQALRALEASDRSLSPSDLSRSGQVPCQVPCVSYHMRVLEELGLVEQTGFEEVRGSRKHYFSSTVGDDDLVRRALRETEEPDRRR